MQMTDTEILVKYNRSDDKNCLLYTSDAADE